MHPYTTGAMASAHLEDLHREAAHHRLVAEARAARRGHEIAEREPEWRTRVAAVFARARHAVTPAQPDGCAPQPACCPA